MHKMPASTFASMRLARESLGSDDTDALREVDAFLAPSVRLTPEPESLSKRRLVARCHLLTNHIEDLVGSYDELVDSFNMEERDIDNRHKQLIDRLTELLEVNKYLLGENKELLEHKNNATGDLNKFYASLTAVLAKNTEHEAAIQQLRRELVERNLELALSRAQLERANARRTKFRNGYYVLRAFLVKRRVKQLTSQVANLKSALGQSIMPEVD